MAGGALKYRHLGRKSSHRQALLRNLVTSLIEHESIKTTWPKAKEAQRLADKLITLGKKNTENSRRKAQAIFFVSVFFWGGLVWRGGDGMMVLFFSFEGNGRLEWDFFGN